MSEKCKIEAFFDEATNTVTYLVIDSSSMAAAVIDPVLDYDHKSGRASTGSASKVLSAAKRMGARIEWVLETHVHADHLSAAPYFKLKTGASVGIGERVCEVQKIFRPVFGADDVSVKGSEFDKLFADNEEFHIGSMEVKVIHTPGHTPACVSYLIENCVFVGDTLFMPDYGTARADFPGGDARVLYRSIKRILSLPLETKIFVCHDYKAPGREHFAWQTSVGEERMRNPHVHDGITEDEFVLMREARDSSLSAPQLLLPSIQVNMRGGHMPPADQSGIRYLRIPVILDEPLQDLL